MPSYRNLFTYTKWPETTQLLFFRLIFVWVEIVVYMSERVLLFSIFLFSKTQTHKLIKVCLIKCKAQLLFARAKAEEREKSNKSWLKKMRNNCNLSSQLCFWYFIQMFSDTNSRGESWCVHGEYWVLVSSSSWVEGTAFSFFCTVVCDVTATSFSHNTFVRHNLVKLNRVKPHHHMNKYSYYCCQPNQAKITQFISYSIVLALTFTRCEQNFIFDIRRSGIVSRFLSHCSLSQHIENNVTIMKKKYFSSSVCIHARWL